MHPSLACQRAAFASDGEAVGWLVENGLLARRMSAPAGLAAEAGELCEAVAACLRAAATDRPPPARAVTRVDDWLVLAGTRPRLEVEADGQPVLGERPAADSPRRALGMLALDAAGLVGRQGWRERLRLCEGCAVVFLDRSPSGRRRWCSMRTCGNRAKARRHRARAAAS